MPYPPFGEVSKCYYFDPHHGGKDFYFDAARGTYLGIQTVNKFGRTTNADGGIATDIWDGANATEDDDVWLAPTAPRIHAITSNDATDIAGGVGARVVRIYGLKTWDTAETYEDVTLNGLAAVNTVQSYAIIHRMKVLSSGASGPNVGDIFATAAVDGTITAMIVVGEGQTQMAVYGIPSTQTLYILQFYVSVLRASKKEVAMNTSLLWALDVKNQPTVFQVKHTLGMYDAAVGTHSHSYSVPNGFSGPGILKLQVVTDQDDSDVSGGFDLVLEDKA